MGAYVNWEVHKLLRQTRFWGSLAVLSFCGALFTYGYLHFRRQSAVLAMIGPGSADGFFVPVLALSTCASLLIPFFVCVMSSDAVAGDRQFGAWAMLLAQGVPAGKLFFAKWVVCLGYAGFCCVTLVGASGLGGLIALGWHSAVLPSGTVVSITQQLWLLAAMLGYAVVGEMSVATLALAASALLRSGLSSLLVAMGCILLMVMWGDLPFGTGIKPFLLTSYLSQVTVWLNAPPEWTVVRAGILVFLAYGIGALGLVLWSKPFFD